MKGQDQSEREELNMIKRWWVSIPYGLLVLLFIMSLQDNINEYLGIVENVNETFLKKLKILILKVS